MSKAVSALNNRVAAGRVTVRDLGLTGMITLRGDFEDENFSALVPHFTGLSIPDVRQYTTDGTRTVLWMSPDELLLIVPYEEAAGLVAQFDEAMAGQHFLAANVSDARIHLAIEGEGAAEVLAKNAPVDMHPEQFVPGMVRRTRIGQIAAGFWMLEDGSFRLVCFRSVAEYAFGLLAQSVEDGAVGAF